MNLLNPVLVALAEKAAKTAFVDPATMQGGGMPPMDPAMMGGGGGMPPMDPSMMGGMPPMDPSMMGGGGGMPPMDPSMMGGMPPAAPPGADPAAIMPLITQAVQAALSGQGGTPSPNGQIKPKIDVNVTLLQILKILAKIADSLGVPIPASEMVATSNDLTSFAQQQAGGGASAPQSAIPPIEPMQGASPELAAGKMASQNGRAYDTANGGEQLAYRADALLRILNKKQGN